MTKTSIGMFKMRDPVLDILWKKSCQVHFMCFIYPNTPLDAVVMSSHLFWKKTNICIHFKKTSIMVFLYSDGLCLFRCLAIQQGASLRSIQTPTLTLFWDWAGHAPPPHFSGVTLSELELIEDKFCVNIDVFHFVVVPTSIQMSWDFCTTKIISCSLLT